MDFSFGDRVTGTQNIRTNGIEEQINSSLTDISDIKKLVSGDMPQLARTKRRKKYLPRRHERFQVDTSGISVKVFIIRKRWKS